MVLDGLNDVSITGRQANAVRVGFQWRTVLRSGTGGRRSAVRKTAAQTDNILCWLYPCG